MRRGSVVGVVAIGAALLLAIGAPGEAAERGEATPNVVVTVTGSGSGLVQDPGALPPISCPPQCSGNHPNGTEVTLTATAAPGSVFGGYTGVTCIGAANPCNFNVGATVHNVTATFNLSTPTDADGDGVPNDSDECPHRPGPADNQGCPVPTPPEPNVRCDKAKAKLKRAKAKLAKVEQLDASDQRIEHAERRVRRAAKAKRRACR